MKLLCALGFERVLCASVGEKSVPLNEAKFSFKVLHNAIDVETGVFEESGCSGWLDDSTPKVRVGTDRWWVC